MKPVIAVPVCPGSNGDYDAINRIQEFGMTALPLYMHIGDEQRLEDNARQLTQADGAVLPGGFPYQDRLGFGVVPARIKPFADAVRQLVDSGKPVIAFCSGNQIAHAMSLAFPKDSQYSVALLPNICDDNGKIVYSGFLDRRLHTKLECPPERTAFTRQYDPDAVIPDIIDHGGGRFWADAETLEYLTTHGMVVMRYCDKDGNVFDNFPVNPNGSMLNIESITNERGNLKIGMCHNERTLSALERGVANMVFASMREYIADGCPDLSPLAQPQEFGIPRDFAYLSKTLNPANTIDIYVKMLTDDNDRMTARVFTRAQIERRRLLRLELPDGYAEEDNVKKSCQGAC